MRSDFPNPERRMEVGTDSYLKTTKNGRFFDLHSTQGVRCLGLGGTLKGLKRHIKLSIQKDEFCSKSFLSGNSGG